MRLRVPAILLLLAAGTAAAVHQFRPELLVDGRYAIERWRAGAQVHERVVDDHRWRFLEAGSGPPLLLVHGFSGSKENWLPAMAHLRGFRVIAVDLLGWGESERRDGADYGVPAQAERLARFVTAMGLERPVVAGHSMGGHIAGVFAARHPELLSRLVLVATAGVHFEENDFARRVQAGETPFNAGTRAEFRRLLAMLFADPPWLPPRALDVLVERNVASHAFHRRMIEVLRRGEDVFLLEAELARIRAPTAVLWCDADRTLDVSAVTAIRRELPAASVTVLRGCGHMPMMERPRETAAVLGGRAEG